jgi:hypothetical protein
MNVVLAAKMSPHCYGRCWMKDVDKYVLIQRPVGLMRVAAAEHRW